jgi:hypothetical protein
MSIWKRLKNLWKLSKWDLNYGDTFRIQKLSKEDSASQSQFLEPISFKERFENSNKIDDLLNN